MDRTQGAVEQRQGLFYWGVLRYPCTWLGGLRLLLLVMALAVYLADIAGGWLFVLLVGAASLLDIADGYLARRMRHVSRFGAAFDFLIDQMTHTVFWLAAAGPVASLLMILEWWTGIAILRAARRGDGHWKEVLLRRGGALVRAYFARQQRNALAALGVVSHFALPAVLLLGWSGWAIWIWVPGVALYAWVTLLMWWTLRGAEKKKCAN
jgi:phosphatidylglycerophosphate synthase